jgi:hypothetical protein
MDWSYYNTRRQSRTDGELRHCRERDRNGRKTRPNLMSEFDRETDKHQVCSCVADPGPYKKWSESATLVCSPYFWSQNHIPPQPSAKKKVFFSLLQYAYVDYQSTDAGFAFICHPLEQFYEFTSQFFLRSSNLHPFSFTFPLLDLATNDIS